MIRRMSFLLAFVLACPTAASAATNSLHDGAWGLEFQVQSPFGSYTGAAGIGAIRHFTDRSAVRLGVMVGISSQDTDGTRTLDRVFPYDTLHTVGQIPSYFDHREVSAFLHLAHYVAMGTRLGMLVEAGPSARWLSEEYGGTQFFPNDTYFNAGDRDMWSYGGDLQLGFQWFFRSRLSLAGRYGVTAQRTESKQTDQYDSYGSYYGYAVYDRHFDESHSSGFSVQTTPAVISLIAYF
jgi:hypothetical protein